MGSCVSKKAARAGAKAKEAPPLPPEKEPAVVAEEEVKEVLSETPVEQEEKVKRVQEQDAFNETASAASSVSAPEKAKLGEVEKKALDAPEKWSPRRRPPESRDAGGHGRRTRSPSPASAQRRPGCGDQPAVVSGIGCRSGRFSPSAARRAAESAVRRTYSAREADMASRAPAKRSLNASVNAGAVVRRDPGDRSGRRPDSPTASRRAPAANRQGSATRKAPSIDPELTKPQCGGGRAPGSVRDELDETERKEVAEGALGGNPSVAMECFIFL